MREGFVVILKQWRRKILRMWIYPFLCFFVVYPYMATVRMVILDKDLKRIRRNRKERFLYALWHEDIPLLSCKFGYTHLSTMASFSRDGEVIANFLKALRYRVVRGTSNKGWREAFDEMIKAFQDGWDLVLAVDGPKGPRYEVKPGVIYLASKGKIKIVPVVSNAKYKIIFHKSWDKMWGPLPFSPAICIFGDPIILDETDSFEATKRKQQELQEALHTLKEKAFSYYS